MEGTQVNAIQAVNNTASNAGNPGAAPTISIVDSNGDDITSQITSGSLAGLLSVRNNLLPSLIGGGQQVGGLNTLAKSLADSINNVLAQGSTTTTPPYQPGSPLFTYNAAAPDGHRAVAWRSVPASLAANSPPPIPVRRSSPTALRSRWPVWIPAAPGPVSGQGFTQYFSSLTATVGNAVNNANTAATAQSPLVAQAKSLQQQVSGVSLDEEAIRLVQLQSSYQAASKVVTVIDDLTQSLMTMIPNVTEDGGDFMISGLSASNDQFLASLNILQSNLSQADEQLSSGLQRQPGFGCSAIHSGYFRNPRRTWPGQYKPAQNLTTIQGQVQAADSAVQSAIQLLNQAVSLGTQGASNGHSTRYAAELATQVQGLEAQLVAISNTEVGGVYVFSGDASGSPPYQVDTSSPTGVDRLITPQQSTLQVAGSVGRHVSGFDDGAGSFRSAGLQRQSHREQCLCGAQQFGASAPERQH